MFIIIGYLIICGSIYGGFALSGGHLAVLFQPLILLMVAGGTAGYFIAANSTHTIRQSLLALPQVFKPDHLPGNTLSILDKVLGHLSRNDLEAASDAIKKTRKAKGYWTWVDPAVLSHMAESMRLATLPEITTDEYVRMSETDLQSCAADTYQTSQAICNAGHAMAAFGVLVTVMGFIHTGYQTDMDDRMRLVSVSLVGIVLGILIGWGFVLAVGRGIRSKQTLLQTQYRCINLALGAHLRGLPPALALEAGRMALPPDCRNWRSDNED